MWQPSSRPCMTAASASVQLLTPCFGSQWYLTSFVSPASLTHLYVLTPKPCIVR